MNQRIEIQTQEWGCLLESQFWPNSICWLNFQTNIDCGVWMDRYRQWLQCTSGSSSKKWRFCPWKTLHLLNFNSFVETFFFIFLVTAIYSPALLSLRHSAKLASLYHEFCRLFPNSTDPSSRVSVLFFIFLIDRLFSWRLLLHDLAQSVQLNSIVSVLCDQLSSTRLEV